MIIHTDEAKQTGANIGDAVGRWLGIKGDPQSMEAMHAAYTMRKRKKREWKCTTITNIFDNFNIFYLIFIVIIIGCSLLMYWSTYLLFLLNCFIFLLLLIIIQLSFITMFVSAADTKHRPPLSATQIAQVEQLYDSSEDDSSEDDMEIALKNQKFSKSADEGMMHYRSKWKICLGE